MDIITPCKDLIAKRYKITDEAIKNHYVDLVLQIKALSINIFTEYDRDKGEYYFETIVHWCFTDKEVVSKNFEYTKEGLEAAYKWIDGQRMVFARKLLE